MENSQQKYCVQFGAPNFRRDVKPIGWLQRKNTGIVPEFRNFNYKNILERFGLFSLTGSY